MGLFGSLPFNYCTNQDVDRYHLSRWQCMGLEYLQPSTMVTKVDQSVSRADFPEHYINEAAKGQTERNGENKAWSV